MTLANSMSGLIAAAKAIDVVGNNIANSQTIGFKSSIARFTSVSAVGNASGPTAKGGAAGVSADNIFQQFTQGGERSGGRRGGSFRLRAASHVLLVQG